MLVSDEKVAPLGIDEGHSLIVISEIADCGHAYLVDKLHWSSGLQRCAHRRPREKTKGVDGSGMIPNLGDKGVGKPEGVGNPDHFICCKSMQCKQKRVRLHGCMLTRNARYTLVD
jgi:hypothetical protein